MIKDLNIIIPLTDEEQQIDQTVKSLINDIFSSEQE